MKKPRPLKKDKIALPEMDCLAYFREHSPYKVIQETKEHVTMCKNDNCPMSTYCWRYNMPPQIIGQEYRMFQPKDDDPLDEGLECSFFIKMPE